MLRIVIHWTALLYIIQMTKSGKYASLPFLHSFHPNIFPLTNQNNAALPTSFPKRTTVSVTINVNRSTPTLSYLHFYPAVVIPEHECIWSLSTKPNEIPN